MDLLDWRPPMAGKVTCICTLDTSPLSRSRTTRLNLPPRRHTHTVAPPNSSLLARHSNFSRLHVSRLCMLTGAQYQQPEVVSRRSVMLGRVVCGGWCLW